MTSYKSYSDIELSVLLKEGDERAYNEIYNRYWKTIYTIAYNRVRSSAVAQDLVHDTFASIWANREKVSVDNLKRYLAVAIKYRVLEFHRRENLQINYKESASYTSPSFSYDVEDALHYKNVLAILDKEIENLPDKCKLIFKYSRNQNKSAKEIANELNLSQSTVENQLNKAINKLRVVLKNLSIFLFSLFL